MSEEDDNLLIAETEQRLVESAMSPLDKIQEEIRNGLSRFIGAPNNTRNVAAIEHQVKKTLAPTGATDIKVTVEADQILVSFTPGGFEDE